jgi:hypothetical protein
VDATVYRVVTDGDGRALPADRPDGRAGLTAAWSATLTDGEAAALAAGVSPLLVRPDSLVYFRPGVSVE